MSEFFAWTNPKRKKKEKEEENKRRKDGRRKRKKKKKRFARDWFPKKASKLSSWSNSCIQESMFSFFRLEREIPSNSLMHLANLIVGTCSDHRNILFIYLCLEQSQRYYDRVVVWLFACLMHMIVDQNTKAAMMLNYQEQQRQMIFA